MSELYTYYDSGAIEIFPSSNAKDNGKLTSEDNIHNILVYAKIKDHVYTEDSFVVSLESGQIMVSRGTASVNGYTVVTTTNAALAVPDVHQPYRIVIKLTFDDSHHIKGDNAAGTLTEGVSIELWEESREPIESREYIFEIGKLTFDLNDQPVVTPAEGLKYVYMAEDIGAIDVEDDNHIKSVQDILDLAFDRYVSRLKDDFKYKTLAFVDDTFAASKSTYTTNDLQAASLYNLIQNDKVELKDGTIRHILSAIGEDYISGSATVLNRVINSTTITDTITGTISQLASNTYMLGHPQNYLKFISSGIDMYASGVKVGTIAGAQTSLYNLIFSADTISTTASDDTLKIANNLTVSKDVRAARVFSAVYNDYAELYEKSNDTDIIEPGDVITLLPDERYGKCTERNSNLVVGVCSDSYGHLLGGDDNLSEEENLKKYIPIGISGRVKVKCVTEDVIPGDLLVSSEYAGYAMVNNFPAVGTVIGKALSTNNSGYVTIQIMLM